MPATASPELFALQKTVVGRYSIERELGRGGMGIVFLARDAALERPVAIKLLPPHLAGEERMRARFVREARLAASLSHPNIVPIHSVEEHADVVFFVMGFVDGETLTARVRRAGPLGPRDGSKLIQELAWALAYAHSAGVIHRDVKPDNVLIDRASGRAMLTDFGIARGGDSGTLTEAGEIVGTAQFVSPEQASGAAVDARSDLYSLGVTAFFALTGRLPFEAPTVVGLLGMHLTQPPPPIATVRAALPPRLAAAVDRCLAKSPAERFTSGERLAEAIADARSLDVEIAPAVRAFLRDRARTGYELVLLYSALLYLGGFAHLAFGSLAGPLSLLAVASVARLFQTARRLLDAGHSFEEVRHALQADADARREELGLTILTRAEERRLQRAGRLRLGGALAMAGGVGAILLSLRQASPFALTLGAASVTAGAFMLRRGRAVAPDDRRQGPLSRWIDQLWQGRLGEWFFTAAAKIDETFRGRLSRKLGGKHAATRATMVANVGAPTEALLARAAEDLLDAMPTGVRAQLGEGRETIARLRAHIEALRKREEHLALAIAEAGAPRATLSAAGVSGANQTLIDRRVELMNDLELAKGGVAARRSSALAALENIRLQLLRLRSGIGLPKDLTADLEAAREIERQISAILQTSQVEHN
jgi:serine/threonine-protein kinase